MHKDIFEKCFSFNEAKQVKDLGIYPYFRSIEETEGNENRDKFLSLYSDEDLILKRQLQLERLL